MEPWRACAEEGGERLSEHKMLNILRVLPIGCNKTTTKLIGKGMLALFRNPDQFARLAGRPGPHTGGRRGVVHPIPRRRRPCDAPAPAAMHASDRRDVVVSALGALGVYRSSARLQSRLHPGNFDAARLRTANHPRQLCLMPVGSAPTCLPNCSPYSLRP